MKSPNPAGLHRGLKLIDAVAIGLGAIIGAGIFVVTGVAAGIAGPVFIIGLLAAGLVASFNALSSAQLAAAYPQSGGTYEYGYRLLNPYLGFSAGWMFLISKLSAAGVVAIGFGTYFYQLLPFVSPQFLSVSAVVLLTAANYFGIRKTGSLNLIIVTITLLALGYMIVSGIPHLHVNNFRPFAPFGFQGIAESAALLFFAFTGYARVATLAEEVDTPQKTIPRAIIFTIISAIILYLAVSIVAVGVTGAGNLSDSIAPLQLVSRSLTTPGIQTVVTLGASTAMLGVLLSQILGISRMLLAMSRRSDLPPFFQAIHPKFQVPIRGIAFTGAVIVLLSLTGSIEFIVRSASFTILLYYSITNLAALQQPAKEQLYRRAVPAFGLLGCLSMSVSLPGQVILTGAALLLGGFLLRSLFHRLYKK